MIDAQWKGRPFPFPSIPEDIGKTTLKDGTIISTIYIRRSGGGGVYETVAFPVDKDAKGLPEKNFDLTDDDKYHQFAGSRQEAQNQHDALVLFWTGLMHKQAVVDGSSGAEGERDYWEKLVPEDQT